MRRNVPHSRRACLQGNGTAVARTVVAMRVHAHRTVVVAKERPGLAWDVHREAPKKLEQVAGKIVFADRIVVLSISGAKRAVVVKFLDNLLSGFGCEISTVLRRRRVSARMTLQRYMLGGFP